MASISSLSYDDLLYRAQERLLRSYGPTLAGRQKLVHLIEELRAAAATANDSDLLGDEGWRIVSIEVQGLEASRMRTIPSASSCRPFSD